VHGGQWDSGVAEALDALTPKSDSREENRGQIPIFSTGTLIAG
jgi:hypothetical protein